MGKIYSKDNRGYSAMPAASLALGIISILTTLFWYMSIIAGVLAIVFGVKSIHRTASKIGKAGMILGIVGISICLVIYLFLTFAILMSM